MKYKIGNRVLFVDKDKDKRIPDDYTKIFCNSYIQKHGSTGLGKEYFENGAIIVDVIPDVNAYVLEWKDVHGTDMRLAFFERSLILKTTNWKERMKGGM